MSAVQLVVTDLDGSLLDHHDYSYAPALPVLQVLEEMRVPVVFASSKTRAEMLALRKELGNEHPFIVENGAAVLIPEGYFLKAPEHTELRDGYWVRELAPPRQQWAAPLAALLLAGASANAMRVGVGFALAGRTEAAATPPT